MGQEGVTCGPPCRVLSCSKGGWTLLACPQGHHEICKTMIWDVWLHQNLDLMIGMIRPDYTPYIVYCYDYKVSGMVRPDYTPYIVYCFNYEMSGMVRLDQATYIVPCHDWADIWHGQAWSCYIHILLLWLSRYSPWLGLIICVFGLPNKIGVDHNEIKE